MKRAIVTDLRYRMALAPVRTLAAAGYEVTGVETDDIDPKIAIGFYSKSLTDKVFLPKEGFGRALLELCIKKGGKKPVLVPVGRAAIDACRRVPELADAADFIVPSGAAMGLSDDKWRLKCLADKLGVPTPATTALSEHRDIEELAGSAKYPAFVKFRNGELMGLKPAERYRIVAGPEELLRVYPLMAARDPDPIVQERVTGRDVGIACVTDRNAELVDYICYESLREFPASGGPTCLARTVSSPAMVRYARRLLKALDFTGISMLDFKGSIEEPELLELNPRVWGSANICDTAGSTLFLSYARAAAGEELPPAGPELSYREGVTMRFSPQNAASFISRLRAGAPLLSTAVEYIRTALDRSVKDGFNIPGDRGPYRRYILNLLSGK